VSSDRDEAGRFRAGHALAGPGRPRGRLDIAEIAHELAEAEGVDLREAVWRVLKALFEAAGRGDSRAAKLLLDRLCGPSKAVDIGDVPTIRLITGLRSADPQNEHNDTRGDN